MRVLHTHGEKTHQIMAKRSGIYLWSGHLASQYKGGHGAAREACEMIMQAQGTLAPMIKGYLS